MNEILKGVLFNGKARVTIINITDLVNESKKIHNMSSLATVTLGRTFVCGSYILSNLKNKTDSFTIIIKGDGPIGNICVSGNGENNIRGYVSNINLELPPKENGHFDVGGAVGHNGSFIVIKDLGLKESYHGTTQLVDGEIGLDFSNYLLKSEGIKNGVSVGVLMQKGVCLAAGGVIVEAMPGISEEELFILEDIMLNLPGASKLILEMGVDKIFDFYFSHLDAVNLGKTTVNLKCSCSKEKIYKTIKGLGKETFDDIIEKEGKIEVFCDFCSKNYIITKEDEKKIWP